MSKQVKSLYVVYDDVPWISLLPIELNAVVAYLVIIGLRNSAHVPGFVSSQWPCIVSVFTYSSCTLGSFSVSALHVIGCSRAPRIGDVQINISLQLCMEGMPLQGLLDRLLPQCWPHPFLQIEFWRQRLSGICEFKKIHGGDKEKNDGSYKSD